MAEKTNLRHFVMAAVLIPAVLILAGISSSVFAQEGTVTDDEVNAVAKDLYCPVCESTPLDVCPTQACADWREVIRDKLSEGQTPDEIRDYFALQYGPRALSEPPREGFSLAVWILSIAAVVIGGVFFIRYIVTINAQRSAELEHLSGAASLDTAESGPDPDSYEARIEKELREKYS